MYVIGKTSRLSFNYVVAPKPCLLRTFRVTILCIATSLSTSANSYHSLQHYCYLSAAPFFNLCFVCFSFSSPLLKFCFLWDFVFSLHCSLVLIDFIHSHQSPYIYKWLTNLYPHSRPFLYLSPVYLLSTEQFYLVIPLVH